MQFLVGKTVDSDLIRSCRTSITIRSKVKGTRFTVHGLIKNVLGFSLSSPQCDLPACQGFSRGPTGHITVNVGHSIRIAAPVK